MYWHMTFNQFNWTYDYHSVRMDWTSQCQPMRISWMCDCQSVLMHWTCFSISSNVPNITVNQFECSEHLTVIQFESYLTARGFGWNMLNRWLSLLLSWYDGCHRIRMFTVCASCQKMFFLFFSFFIFIFCGQFEYNDNTFASQLNVLKSCQTMS